MNPRATMASLERFLKHVMHNNFEKEENDTLVKYYNPEFEVISQKKTGKSCIVVDKRGHPTVYNDIAIALQSLLVKN